MIPWVSLALGIAVQGPVQATLAGRGQGVLFWGVGTQAKCAAVSSLAPGPSSTLSAGSAALRGACCFVQNSNQKACDSRMKGLSLRIQTFFRGNLSSFPVFPQRERKFSPDRDTAETLECLFRVALREASQVLCALGSWHICRLTMWV